MEKPYEYDKVRFSDGDAVIRNNEMVRDFIESDSDILVKMDIDQVYPKDYLTVMVPLAEKYKLAGPLIYSKWRRSGYYPLLCDDDTLPLRRKSTNWFKRIPKNGIIKVGYAHTNLFYHREVLENIGPPWYEVKHNKSHCAHTINRDFSFIRKIIKQGFKTHINMNMVVGHLVEESVNTETYKRWCK